MNLDLAGKKVFISGSSQGIGLETATVLCREGASCIIHGRNPDTLVKALSVIKSKVAEANVEAVSADLSIAEDYADLYDKIADVDILINNLGIYKVASFYDMMDDDWYQQFEINVMSAVRLSRFLLPKMLDKGWGRLLFLSSECAYISPVDLIGYNFTKAGLLNLTAGLAQLTRGSDITVNAVIPGSTYTESAHAFMQSKSEQTQTPLKQTIDDFFRTERSTSTLQRFITTEEVANTIAYHCSPLSSATNGAAIRVDGGSIRNIF